MKKKPTVGETADINDENNARPDSSSHRYGGLWKEVWRRFRKNKAALVGLALLILMIICAIFADQIAPYGYDDQDLSRAFQKPCLEYPFGTDNVGRDILSRVIYGARISLRVGLISVSISVLCGGILGAIAAFYSARLDNIIMRCIDVLLAIPPVLLSISIAAALGPGLMNLMIAVGIGAIPSYARIVRATVLSIKEQEFIEAARSIGASDFRIIAQHILPNALSPIIVQATLGVADAILIAASLSFIGLGIQPPIPEWGGMLSAGRSYFRDYPHVIIFPGLAIMVTILALNIVGDGFRDAVDPRMKN